MRKTFGMVSLALWLGGCSTPYQPAAGSWTGGYSEQAVNVRTWEVEFSGNGYTSSSASEAMALRRAAELCVMNFKDCAGFIIANSKTDVSESSWTTPVTCSKTGYGVYSTVQCTGGNTSTAYKPSSKMVVVFVTSDEAKKTLEAGRVVYDAGMVLGQAPRIR